MRDRELLIKFRVGVFVLVLLLLFVAFVLTIGIQTRVFEAQYPLRAAFRELVFAQLKALAIPAILVTHDAEDAPGTILNLTESCF